MSKTYVSRFAVINHIHIYFPKDEVIIIIVEVEEILFILFWEEKGLFGLWIDVVRHGKLPLLL